MMSMGCCIADSTVHRCETAKQLERAARAKGRGRGLGPAIDEELIKNLMEEAKMVRPTDILVIVDCRMFADPSGRTDRLHIGLHDTKVSNFVNMPNNALARWMGGFKAQILQAHHRLQPGCRLLILTYCRKGAHRSVSGAKVLDHCVRRELNGTHVLPMHHFSKLHEWRKSYCGECRTCIDSSNSYIMSEAELFNCHMVDYPSNKFPDQCRSTTQSRRRGTATSRPPTTDRYVIL